LVDALSVDGFNFDAATAAVNAADITPANRAIALAALRRANGNPALIGTVLEQVRGLLGM
jgi:hypothetical protein